MTWPIILALSMYVFSVASEECQDPAPESGASGVVMLATRSVIAKGTSLEHREGTRSTADAEETTEVAEGAGAGAAEYEHAGARVRIAADSDVALRGRGLWIITVDAGCTSADVERMKDHMPAGSTANYSGSPDDGGLCVFMMEGTKSQVEEELATHTWPSPPDVTADHPFRAVPEVSAHEEGDALLESAAGGAPASWGLDRVDDPKGLDNDYSPQAGYANQGKGANVYVLDTGIRISHSDFGGRAYSAFTVYPRERVCSPRDPSCAADGEGHGTHCAGTIGGKAYGVAKNSNLYAVKVADDRGQASLAGIIKGIEYVMTSGHTPAIISMSLGGPGGGRGLRTAVHSAVRKGIPVVVAAGNEGMTRVPDACNHMPGDIPFAIRVGATNRPTGTEDMRAPYSSYGRCLDIFAPGTSIKSASHRTDTWASLASGTSMACPHVAGVAALMMAEDPQMSPAKVKATIQSQGAAGTVRDARGSPSLMLQIGKWTPKQATDGHASCPAWARAGECAKNPGWMLVNCKKSCKDRKDKSMQCPHWASIGECARNPGYMLHNCPTSCHGKRDKNAHCPAWAKQGHCTRSKGYMDANCKKSCARDGNASCPGWAAKGECARNPTYMLVHCQKSCGV